MPFLNTATHKNILLQILKDIYSDTTIAPFLGFKGGTAALMFYGLNRFSIDLDFDLLDEQKEGHVFARIEEIAKKYGRIKDVHKKRLGLFFLLSYEDKARTIKIEVNRREFGSRYELKTYLGISMLVMAQADMFAHKLMALTERVGKTSRDVWDVWFFLEHRWPINKEIVKKRAKMPFEKLLKKCIGQLEKMSDRNILDGLGDFLTPQQKDWARVKLRAETIFLLKARLE